MEPEGTCSDAGCNRPVWWGITELNKRMPVDPPARADGRVVRVVRDGKIRLHVLTGTELPWQGPVTDTEGPFMPHHVTCAAVATFRSGRRKPTRYAHALTCRVCNTRMNVRVTATEGTSTHPCCDPTDGQPRPAAAAARPATPPADTLNIPENA